MNTKKIAAAVAAVVAVGVVAINQTGYQGQVKTGVDNLVEQLNNTHMFGESLQAELTSHQGGVFSSSGVIAVKADSGYRPTEFKLNYTVNHGLTAFLTGATYDAELINSVMDGNDKKTITSVLLDGQSVVIEGSLGSDSIDGTLTVPAIKFSEGRGGLEAQPMMAEFYVGDFDDQGTPRVYEVLAGIPFIKFQDRREGFELKDGSLELSSEFDGKEGNGAMSLAVNNATITKEGRRQHNEKIELKDLAVAMNFDLEEEFSSEFNLEFGEFTTNGESLSNVEVGYKLAGIDGQSIIDIIKLSEQATQEGWSERRIQQSVESIFRERADNLLAYNPELKIKRIKADMNGELLIDAEGMARLDASKLPRDLLKSSFEYNRAPSPQKFMNAILVDFEAELGKNASNMASALNPMAAGILSESGDKFTFKIEDGETTLNGERI